MQKVMLYPNPPLVTTYFVFAGGLTWTMCRGCTDRVGKFPRPWIGMLSPRMESNRRTWSQDSTLTLGFSSGASPEESPEDMVQE